MERVRAVTGRARAFLASGLVAAAGLSGGCAATKTLESVQHTVKEAVAPAKHAPATEFVCGWQNRLASLPDPTKGGTMIPGLVGQAFIFTAELKPAEIDGELTITMNDATTRRPGVPAMRPEVYHFTKDVARRLVTNDERFGRSLVLFLPWPEAWRDVDHLYIQARYDQPEGNTLYAMPTSVTIDFSNPAGAGPTNGVAGPPDPALLLKQARGAALGIPAQGGIPSGVVPGPQYPQPQPQYQLPPPQQYPPPQP